MDVHVFADLVIAANSAGDFFTGQSLGTFAGASGAVVVVGNTLRRVSGRELLWLILLISLLFSYLAADITGHPHSLADFGLVALNGCLLFCTALGINETVVSAKQEAAAAGKPKAQGGRTIRWFDTWVPPTR
jgi:hypothetical protein